MQRIYLEVEESEESAPEYACELNLLEEIEEEDIEAIASEVANKAVKELEAEAKEKSKKVFKVKEIEEDPFETEEDPFAPSSPF